MGPYSEEPKFTPEQVTVNVPANTSGSVINDILGNLPNITSALGSIFGWSSQNQPPQQIQQKQDLTPVYLIGGAIILILLTKK